MSLTSKRKTYHDFAQEIETQFTLVCKMDCEVVYMSSHFPSSKSDFRGPFVGLAASSFRAI